MNAKVENAWLEKRSSRPVGHRASLRLAAAIDALATCSLDADSTLVEACLALEGTAFTWSSEGKLTCSAERLALADELDELIDAFGGCTPVARLFPAVERGVVLGALTLDQKRITMA